VARSLPRIALVWSQFAPYHVDRCEAVGRRLAGNAEVLAIEVASASETYAWAPSGDLAGVTKQTLFPGRSFDTVGRRAKFRALWSALRGCRQVYMGIPYSAPEVIVLSWLLRLRGVELVMMTDSKFDDMERSVWFEAWKGLLLAAYRAAVVAGRRQVRYLHFLGFRKRRVLLGYDVVSVDRIRAQAEAAREGPELAMADRDFLFVGRFVAKKRLLHLIEAYAAYVAVAGTEARRLVLVCSGPDEPAMRARIAELGLGDRVVFTGFLQDAAIAAAMDRALALVLVSVEEQWGLVVNEALRRGPATCWCATSSTGSRCSLTIATAWSRRCAGWPAIQPRGRRWRSSHAHWRGRAIANALPMRSRSS